MEKFLDLKSIKELSKNNLISVVFPIYNASMYIDESIESILNQSYSNFELILINDGSTDNSKDVMKKFRDDHPEINVKIFLHNENAGVVRRSARCYWCVVHDPLECPAS